MTSTSARRFLGRGRPDEPGPDAAAARADAAVGPIDWAAPIPGARYPRFAVPSGSLAGITMDAVDEPGPPGTDRAAERVLLLPGLTGSKEDFALVLPLLAAAGYRAESVDLAGQYESADAGPPAGEHYDYPLYVDDTLALLTGGGPAHVVGYSFAGIVAQLAAVARPDLVRSLTLVSTPPGYGNGFRGVSWIGWASGAAPERVVSSLMLWGIRNNLNRVDPERLAFVRRRFALTRRDSVDDTIGLMMRIPDVRAGVAALDLPKLVAVGKHDLWPVRRHARFAASIGARAGIYGSGHSPNETAPHQLVADLVRLYRGDPVEPGSAGSAPVG
jgi:pimeloyl-ACP methyl ester carboxylesterase